MSRTLATKVFLRLLLAVLPLVALIYVSRLLSPLWLCTIVLVWVVAMSLWTSVALHRILLPLQTSANSLVEGQAQPVSASAPDFDELAHSLASAAGRVQGTLRRAGESRRELEALLDSMQDAVVAVDAAGRIQWTNQRMQRLILAPPGAESIGGSVRVGHALVQTIRDPDVLQCVRA